MALKITKSVTEEAGKSNTGSTSLSTLNPEGGSLISAVDVAYKACHYVYGFVSYTWLLIRLINLRILPEIARLCRNLTGEKMLNSWCWTVAKFCYDFRLQCFVIDAVGAAIKSASIVSMPEVTQLSLAQGVWKLLSHVKAKYMKDHVLYHCFCLLQTSHSLHLLPRQHWGVICNNHGD